MSTGKSPPPRIISLDQFRGYTVVGMLLVNFVGYLKEMPVVFKHWNTYCSYADTIMPQFFFCVGFAYRLTLLKRLQSVGAAKAYLHVVQRSLGLVLLGAVIYHLDGRVDSWKQLHNLGFWGFLQTAFQRELFQTLVHIGVTSLWIMPVIAAGPGLRIFYALGSVAIHWYASDRFYYDWVMHRPGIDGGPLGFLTWTVPMLAGSFAYDWMSNRGGGSAVVKMVIWGSVLMLLGYALACLNTVTPPNKVDPHPWTNVLVEPPFARPPVNGDNKPIRPDNLWTMSQRAGSSSYLIFSAGFSMFFYAFFVIACDFGPIRVGIFRTFGSNALAAYILHPMVFSLIKPYTPADAPLWYGLAAVTLAIGLCYVFIRYLEKNNIYLKL